MTNMNILLRRLHNQHLGKLSQNDPSHVVRWLGAVQAQDYLGALWAVGQRIKNATEETVEQAVAEGAIVRSWPMRGTLHFVAPEDLRWMLKLLTPRIISRSATLYKQAGLDRKIFLKSAKLITKALEEENQLTRTEIYSVLEGSKIATTDQRGLHILGYLAQEGLVCFGPRIGKQQTFVLLDDWVPPAKTLTKEESLHELAKRYFTSHGPATLNDFAWWSGLTVTEAKEGLGSTSTILHRESISNQTYWFSEGLPLSADLKKVSLLPTYDEYIVGYKNRDMLLGKRVNKKNATASSLVFSSTVVYKGQAIGSWRRLLKKDAVVIELERFAPFSKEVNNQLNNAAKRYAQFLGLPVSLE